MKGRVFVELEMVAAEEGAGQVNLAHMGGSLEAPEWKAARHGIAWHSGKSCSPGSPSSRLKAICGTRSFTRKDRPAIIICWTAG